MASESLEANVNGEDITTGFNPAYLLDGLTAIESPFVELAFTQASQARRTLRCGLPRGRRGQRLPLPADAAPPALLSQYARPHPHQPAPLEEGHQHGHRTRRPRQDGWQHAHPAAQRRPHGGRLRPQPRRQRRRQPGGHGGAAAQPQGRLGDGAGRRPHPRHDQRARRAALRGRPGRRRRQLQVDRRPDQRRDAWARRASASSTAASPAASGAWRTATP